MCEPVEGRKKSVHIFGFTDLINRLSFLPVAEIYTNSISYEAQQ